MNENDKKSLIVSCRYLTLLFSDNLCWICRFFVKYIIHRTFLFSPKFLKWNVIFIIFLTGKERAFVQEFFSF